MTFLFEFDPPCRLYPEVERIGPITRIIWLWWSIAFIRAGFNDFLCVFEQEGWDLAKAGKPRPAFKKGTLKND